LARAFLGLGLTEAVVALTAFVVVLVANGWQWGASPPAAVLATASGTAFAAIALGQMANAFACRSTVLPVWRLNPWSNPLILYAVVAQALLLVALLGIPPVADLLGGTWPSAEGWMLAAVAIPAVVLVDAVWKRVWTRRGRSPRTQGRRHAEQT
jgi:magnesium-transporting ATPase (P-type)